MPAEISEQAARTAWGVPSARPTSGQARQRHFTSPGGKAGALHSPLEPAAGRCWLLGRL